MGFSSDKGDHVMSAEASARSHQLKARIPGIAILDANDPEIEVTIGEHIFRGRAFALDYEKVPPHLRDVLQDAHVEHMRSMQALARQRFAQRLS